MSQYWIKFIIFFTNKNIFFIASIFFIHFNDGVRILEKKKKNVFFFIPGLGEHKLAHY